MKRLFGIIILMLACVAASAQVKSYQDNETSTFVIGLDSYFYGDNGSLGYKVKSKDICASVFDGAVYVNGDVLEQVGKDEIVIGTHDFTGDRKVELVVAHRTEDMLFANVYKLTGTEWKLIGRIGAADKDAREIRVFRQAFTIKNKRTNALYTWTYHAPKFDFKASDKIADPTPEL